MFYRALSSQFVFKGIFFPMKDNHNYHVNAAVLQYNLFQIRGDISLSGFKIWYCFQLLKFFLLFKCKLYIFMREDDSNFGDGTSVDTGNMYIENRNQHCMTTTSFTLQTLIG